MKAVFIIRNINENFKQSSAENKIANSVLEFKTPNLEEGIVKFNKLKVSCEMFIVDMTSESNPIYYQAAKKDILSEENNLRVLQTTILNQEVLKDINEILTVGVEKEKLFI